MPRFNSENVSVYSFANPVVGVGSKIGLGYILVILSQETF